MLRVGDLQRSIDFYTQVLGMQLLRKSDNAEYKYSLAFVGFGGNPDQAEIELTYNWGVDSYDAGTAFGHVALGVPDAALGSVLANLPMQHAQCVKHAVVKVAPEDEWQNRCPQRLCITALNAIERRNDATLEPGKTLPFTAVGLKIILKRAE